MSGIFTGVGVGPGDPELITLKAVRAIRKSQVIAVPVSDTALTGPIGSWENISGGPFKDNPVCEAAETDRLNQYLEKCVAYQIARKALPEIEKKEKIFLPMPMIKDKEQLKAVHELDTKAIGELLKKGKNVAFLTLGDPTVYSTCMYVHKRLKKNGFCTELVPGITSFCAAAARMDVSLAENREELHILPASYHIEESLSLAGTKVLMKAGKKLPKVKELLRHGNYEVNMIENCGMAEEKVYQSAEEIPDEAGYYSLLIVKEKKKPQKKKAEEETR